MRVEDINLDTAKDNEMIFDTSNYELEGLLSRLIK